MQVKDFMTKDPFSCGKLATVGEAAAIMATNNISVLPVVDNEHHLVGILTATDFVGKEIDIPHALVSVKRLLGETYHNMSVEDIYAKAKDYPVEKVMTSRPTSISSDKSLDAVIDLMVRRNLKRLPVIDGKRLVGIISRKNIIRAFHEFKKTND